MVKVSDEIVMTASTEGEGSGRRRGLAGFLRDESGQGTTEYAILVGVLVLIAIVAILAFRDRISTLWDSIAQGINSL